jgi:raffinose/stachyose/melibiose transport system substrate-binding protein
MSLLQPARATTAHRRRARAVLATAAAGSLLLLGACSSGDGGGGDGTTKLTFFSWDGEPAMAPIIDAFEAENPDITVDFSSAPPVAEYVSTLQTRLSSGTAADVFVMAAENKSDLIENEAVLPLTDEPFMTNVAQFNKDTYSGDDGQVYALSTSSWGAGIVYNKELTDKAGMTQPPATWEELLTAMGDIKDATGVAPFYDNTLQEIPMTLQALLGSSIQGDMGVDQQIFDGKSTFADTWTAPVKTWSEPYDDGLISTDVLGLNGDQVLDEFINGRVAMVATGPWSVPTIRAGAPDMDFGYMPIPAPEGEQAYLPGAASPGWAINADTKNVDAAKKFLTFLGSPEGVELYNKQTAAITTTTDFEPVVDPVLDTVVDPIRAGKVYLAQISWPEFQDTLTTQAVAGIQQMLLGQAKPADVGADLDRELKEQQG